MHSTILYYHCNPMHIILKSKYSIEYNETYSLILCWESTRSTHTVLATAITNCHKACESRVLAEMPLSDGMDIHTSRTRNLAAAEYATEWQGGSPAHRRMRERQEGVFLGETAVMVVNVLT